MSERPSANRQIARAAGIVMVGFVLSNLTSLVRQVLEANAFGTGAEIDAFNAALRLPDTLFLLVAGGALASAFIPTFTGYLEREEKKEAWKLASAVLNLVFLILVGISLLSAIFAPQIVATLLAPSFGPDQQALTASLLRILLLTSAIFGVSGLLMGILNTHQHFILPAVAPTFYWGGQIIGLLVFVPLWGIHGLAWGAVLGAVLHLGVQLPALRAIDWKYTPTLGLRIAGVREVVRLMGPRLIGVGVVQLNFWINVLLATGQAEGSLTALTIAFKVMTMPQVVIAQAIAIAALPTFSAQVARGQLADMRASLAATLRSVIFLSLPATIGLILLREPVVAMLFERGEFTAQSTQLAAWALLWYTVGLVGHSVVEIVSRSFYALSDTKTPVAVGAATMGLNVLLSFVFVAWFERIGWMPHGGLALANTVATSLEMVVLLVLMRRRLNGLGGRRILQGVTQASLGSVVLALGVWGWMGISENVWVVGIGGVAIGGILYAVVMLVLRVEEVSAVIAIIQKKLTKQGS